MRSPERRKQKAQVDSGDLGRKAQCFRLTGKYTIGVYPLLPDENCWFLAVDFEKTTWKEDARAFFKISEELGVPAALERSRSGNGGHMWIFFDSPIQAVLARKLGSAILTYTMERHPQLGLDSYDRFFPSQDTMPKGGFGFSTSCIICLSIWSLIFSGSPL